MEKFERYQDVPKVGAFRDMVDLISRNLHQQILREFQLLWIVSDPFAGRFAVSDNSTYEEKQQLRIEQEQVWLPFTSSLHEAPWSSLPAALGRKAATVPTGLSHAASSGCAQRNTSALFSWQQHGYTCCMYYYYSPASFGSAF